MSEVNISPNQNRVPVEFVDDIFREINKAQLNYLSIEEINAWVKVELFDEFVTWLKNNYHPSYDKLEKDKVNRISIWGEQVNLEFKADLGFDYTLKSVTRSLPFC
jgi:hypothetical protein